MEAQKASKFLKARSERMGEETVGVMMAFPESMRLNESKSFFPALFL